MFSKRADFFKILKINLKQVVNSGLMISKDLQMFGYMNSITIPVEEKTMTLKPKLFVIDQVRKNWQSRNILKI